MVDLDHHLLAARQKIVLGEGVAMGDLIELVAAGMYSIAPFALGRWCEGDPRRHDIGLTQAPIGRVLVPRHEGRIGRLIDEEVGGPAQQIRAVEILDRVEDRAAPHVLGEPGKQQCDLWRRSPLSGPPVRRSNASSRPRSSTASVSDITDREDECDPPSIGEDAQTPRR